MENRAQRLGCLHPRIWLACWNVPYPRRGETTRLPMARGVVCWYERSSRRTTAPIGTCSSSFLRPERSSRYAVGKLRVFPDDLVPDSDSARGRSRSDWFPVASHGRTHPQKASFGGES